MKAIISATVAALLFSSPGAHADSEGLYLSEGLLGYSLSFNDSPANVTQRREVSSETGLGYIIGGWFYLGGVFNYTAVNERTTDALNVATTHQEVYEYYGPTIGWMGDSLFILGSYYANAEKKDAVSTGGATALNYDNTGAGFGVNVGYKFAIGPIEAAPMLSFKFITYTNCKDPVSGVTSTCNPAINQNEITPYVTLLFNFK